MPLGHILNAGLGAVGLLLLFAVAMGVAAGSVTGDIPGQFRDLTAPGLVQLLAIFLIGAAGTPAIPP